MIEGGHGGSLFDEIAKFLPEARVVLGALLGYIVQLFDQAFGERYLNVMDDPAALYRLARDVEGRSSESTLLDEAQVLGEQILVVFLDEIFFA